MAPRPTRSDFVTRRGPSPASVFADERARQAGDVAYACHVRRGGEVAVARERRSPHAVARCGTRDALQDRHAAKAEAHAQEAVVRPV